MKDTIRKAGHAWQTMPIIADVDSSVPSCMVNRSPCITGSRGVTGHWLVDQQRRLSIQERSRLMGFDFDRIAGCKGFMSDNQLGELLGNAITAEPFGSPVVVFFFAFSTIPSETNQGEPPKHAQRPLIHTVVSSSSFGFC